MVFRFSNQISLTTLENFLCIVLKIVKKVQSNFHSVETFFFGEMINLEK